MINPMNKEIKHVKDQNVDEDGYSKYTNTKIKTEYTNLM